MREGGATGWFDGAGAEFGGSKFAHYVKRRVAGNTIRFF
jgi:hypothetical protein